MDYLRAMLAWGGAIPGRLKLSACCVCLYRTFPVRRGHISVSPYQAWRFFFFWTVPSRKLGDPSKILSFVDLANVTYHLFSPRWLSISAPSVSAQLRVSRISVPISNRRGLPVLTLPAATLEPRVSL